MILVTGATGLVGSHLLVKLIREKQKVRALYRSKAKKEYAKKIISFYFDKDTTKVFETIEWMQVDINDIPTLTEAFEDVTHVYHCAAKISFNPSHFKKLRKVNIEGTANIVNLCLTTKVEKLCYVSSIATLGEDHLKSFIDENSEWNPETFNSVYAITKYGAEMEVWRGIQEGLNAVMVNPGIIIGAGFYNGGSGFLFKRIYAGMKYYTTGATGYIAIDDVIQIMHQLMTGNYTNQRYILVAENLSYKDAFSMIAKALNKKIPTKKATLFLLNIAYHIQLFGSRIFGTKRSIFKSSIQSALSQSHYKNDKIKNELSYSFIPIKTAVEKTAAHFLKEL